MHGHQPFPFRDDFLIIPLRPADRFRSLDAQQRILAGCAALQQAQRLLHISFQAIPVILPVLELQQAFRVDTGQAVPKPDGAVLLPGQIQGISPVAQLFIAHGEAGLFRFPETAQSELRIPGRRIQQVRGIDALPDSKQGAVPVADRQAFLKQPLRLGPFPGIHVGGGEPQGHLRPIQGIRFCIESLPSLPQIDGIFPDIVRKVVRIRHDAANHPRKTAVTGLLGLL